MADQLMFPSSGVDIETAELLALIDGDPIHERDRAAVVAAIVASAKANGGAVDPNDVRQRIPRSVFPRVVGSTYQSLAAKGVLVADGWVISNDTAGRNAGRPARRYRLRPSLAGVA